MTAIAQGTPRGWASCLWAGGRFARVVALFVAFMLLAFTAPAVRGAVLCLQAETGQSRLWEDKLPVRTVPSAQVAKPGARPMPVVLPSGPLGVRWAIAHEAPPAWSSRRPDSRGPPSDARAPPKA